MDAQQQKQLSFKRRGSDVYWEKKRDSLRRMFHKSRKPSRYDSYGRLVSSTSQLNLISSSYTLAPARPLSDDLSSMFSRHLHDSVDETTGVNNFVLWCVDEIETTGEHLYTDAIYRAAGNQGRVQLIVYTSEGNMRQVLRSEENVNVLTGALKLFFRRLKMPIIDYRQFNQAFKSESPTDELRLLISGLPETQKNTLAFLMLHLRKVLELQDANKMGIASLGVVFGPTLMRLAPDSVDMAADMKQQNRLFEYLLINYQTIFSQQLCIEQSSPTPEKHSLYSVVNKIRTERPHSDSDSSYSETSRAVTEAVIEKETVRRKSSTDSSETRRTIAATVVVRRSNADSSESESERRSVVAIDKKLKVHHVSTSSDISRPNSQPQNSLVLIHKGTAGRRYSSSSSDSDGSHSKKKSQAAAYPASVSVRPAPTPVRPAPSIPETHKTPVPNNMNSFMPSNFGNTQENINLTGNSNQPASMTVGSSSRPASITVGSSIKPASIAAGSSSRPASIASGSSNRPPSIASRPSTIPPAPPVLVIHRNPTNHVTSSSASDQSDNERTKITTKRISRPVAIPVPPTPPTTPVSATTVGQPQIHLTTKHLLKKYSSSSESDRSDSKRQNKILASSNHSASYPEPPALPTTSPPGDSLSGDSTSGSNSDDRKRMRQNKNKKHITGDDTNSSDSETRKRKPKSMILTSSSKTATKPVTSVPSATAASILGIRKHVAGDNTSSSDSETYKSKPNTTILTSSSQTATKPVTSVPSLKPASIFGIRKRVVQGDTSSSDSETRKNKNQTTILTSSSQTSTNPVTSVPPSKAPSVLGISRGDDTSSSDSETSKNKKQTVILTSTSQTATKPVPPSVPAASLSVVIRPTDSHSSVSKGEKKKSDSDHSASNSKPVLTSTTASAIVLRKSEYGTGSSYTDKRDGPTSDRPTVNPGPPPLPSTSPPVHVVRKSLAGSESSSSEWNKSTNKQTNSTSKNYSTYKSYAVQSSNTQDSTPGNLPIGLRYSIKPEPIYSNQDEVDANQASSDRFTGNIRSIDNNNKLAGANTYNTKEISIVSNQNPAESHYSIDTYRNRQMQRLTAAFDSPTDIDSASAFASQIYDRDQPFMTSLNSSWRVTKLDQPRNVSEIPTASHHVLASNTTVDYSTVSQQQKFKQTSYTQQSKVVKVTQLSLPPRQEDSDSDSSTSSLSGSDDSQRVDAMRRSVLSKPTAI